MIYFARAFWAEVRKQHRVYFHDTAIYFSMLLWPILEILTAIYMFKPFTVDGANGHILEQHLGSENVEMFLLIGYLGYNFFFSLVQSAWRFSSERFWGTLELIMMTPANRFAVILGNAASALIESMWLFTIFAGVGYFIFLREQTPINVGLLLLSLGVTIVAAVAWGALLNSFFLLTRDAGLFYTILQGPLNFFAGVRFPINLFNSWMRAISYVFPLTYCLNLLRKVVSGEGQLAAIWGDLVGVTILIIVMMIVSYWLIGFAEKRAKKNGSLILF